MNKFIAVAVLTSVISAPAFAEGFYGFADLGKNKLADACTGVTAGQTCSDSGTAFRFGGGYQLNPNLALEASYLNIGEASKLIDTSTPGVTVNATAKVTAFQLGGVGILPLNEQFSVFAKAGVALATTDISGTVTGLPGVTFPSSSSKNNNFSWGLGARYILNDKLAVRAQYEDFGQVDGNGTTKSKVTLMSAGLVVMF